MIGIVSVKVIKVLNILSDIYMHSSLSYMETYQLLFKNFKCKILVFLKLIN